MGQQEQPFALGSECAKKTGWPHSRHLRKQNKDPAIRVLYACWFLEDFSPLCPTHLEQSCLPGRPGAPTTHFEELAVTPTLGRRLPPGRRLCQHSSPWAALLHRNCSLGGQRTTTPARLAGPAAQSPPRLIQPCRGLPQQSLLPRCGKNNFPLSGRL